MSSSLAESIVHAASLDIAGKKEEALAELIRAREAGPRSVKVDEAIGRLQFDLGRYREAAASYGEAVSADRDNALAHYNRAVCLEKLGEWEASAAAFRTSIELDSRRAGAHLGFGISNLRLGRPQEALPAFEKCLERQPFREAALRGRAVALHLVGRYAEASSAYSALLARDPQSEELLGNLISLAIGSGDHELLASCSERLLRIQPASLLALEGAALAAFARRDFDAAWRHSAALVELRHDHFAGWFNCGVALQKLGDYEQAADAYSRAASVDPQSAEAFLSVGTVLHELGRWDAARQAYETALALEPGLKTALWNLGLLCESRGELREAAGLYERLADCHADAQEAWFRLGYLRLQMGEFGESIRAFQACLAVPKKCPEALLNLGIAQWRTRNVEAAKDAFRQCVSSPATAAAAMRCLAAIALEQQDYDRALTLHKQLLELGEPNSDLLYNLALLLQKRGRPAEAVRYYRQALAERPEFPQALLNLGHAFMALGKHEEAQSAWQAALRGNVDLAEHFLI